MYQRYDCRGCKMKVTMLPTSNTVAASSIVWGIIPNNDSAFVFTRNDLVELPLAKWKTMNALYGAGRNQSISYYMTTQKIKGISKGALFDDTYRADTNQTPISQWYWNLITASVDGSTIPACNFVVELTYYVKFYGRKTLTS